MKKIIDGKLYNTDTANELGYYTDGSNWSDFRHVEETLYRKRTGEFFLYGEGGPMTQYAKACGQNEWTGGDLITPMTEESARKWAEDRLSADDYEKIFGEVSEDDPDHKVLSANLPIKSYNRLKSMSTEAGKSMSAILSELIDKAE